MGIFFEHAKCFNRAPIALTVRFDGQDMTVQPGEFTVPKQVVPFAKNQNPIMGTADPNNPHISGGQYLIGVVGKDDCAPLTKEEWETHCSRPCRIDEQAAFQEKYGSDPKAKLVTQGKGRKSTATSRYDAGVNERPGLAEFTGRD